MHTAEYFAAIRAGDVERLRRLVAAEPGLLAARDRPDHAPERDTRPTGLHVAVHAGQPDAARALIDAGADLETRTSEGRTALHDSIELGQPAITEMLLAAGACLDVCSAAILGKRKRLRALLDADPALANDRSTGLSPLGWAAFGNAVETARELIERGARMDDGELLCAASVGHVEVGRFLLERGADPNALFPDNGANALHAAAAMRYSHDTSRFVELLLDHGADPTIRARDGRSAREIAEQKAAEQARASDRDFSGVIALLRRAGG